MQGFIKFEQLGNYRLASAHLGRIVNFAVVFFERVGWDVKSTTGKAVFTDVQFARCLALYEIPVSGWHKVVPFTYSGNMIFLSTYVQFRHQINFTCNNKMLNCVFLVKKWGFISSRFNNFLLNTQALV